MSIVVGTRLQLRGCCDPPDFDRSSPGAGRAQSGRSGGSHLRNELLRPVPGLLADRSRGADVATQSIAGSDQLNTLLDQIYTAAGASTADPSSLFETDDTDPIGAYKAPRCPRMWPRCASGPMPALHREASSPTTRAMPNWRRRSSRSSTACRLTRRPADRIS